MAPLYSEAQVILSYPSPEELDAEFLAFIATEGEVPPALLVPPPRPVPMPRPADYADLTSEVAEDE